MARRDALFRIYRSCERYYPFTATGTLVFWTGIYFFASGSALGDPYRTTLGVLAAATTLLLALLSRLQAGRFTDIAATWFDPEQLPARTFGSGALSPLTVVAGSISPWYFFRLHARIRGTLVCGQRTRFHVFEEIASSESERIDVPLYLPLPGRLNCRRTLQIRDIFGLSRAGCGNTSSRPLDVHAPLPLAPELTRMVTASGEQESSRTSAPEEERYYMREYIAGDRFRDINWKASSRIRELFTRISPQTQEQDRTITLYIRHFASDGQESIESLAHLAYIKGWSIAFMKAIMREESGIHFRVITARGSVLIEDEDAVDQYAKELAVLHFQPEPTTLERDRAARSVIVFTTPFDDGLAAFTEALVPIETRLFCTQFPGFSSDAGNSTQDRLDLTLSASALPLPPFRRSARAPKRAVHASSGTIVLEESALTPIWARKEIV